jgi:acyl-coenzyme A thioesterase PaaI-like protein
MQADIRQHGVGVHNDLHGVVARLADVATIAASLRRNRASAAFSRTGHSTRFLSPFRLHARWR